MILVLVRVPILERLKFFNKQKNKKPENILKQLRETQKIQKQEKAVKEAFKWDRKLREAGFDIEDKEPA